MTEKPEINGGAKQSSDSENPNIGVEERRKFFQQRTLDLYDDGNLSDKRHFSSDVDPFHPTVTSIDLPDE